MHSKFNRSSTVDSTTDEKKKKERKKKDDTLIRPEISKERPFYLLFSVNKKQIPFPHPLRLTHKFSSLPMESLTLSTSLSPHCPSFNLRHASLPKLSPTFSPYPSRKTPLSLKSSLTSHQSTSKPLSDSHLVADDKLSLLLASAPQSPGMAMRGAEGDAMGLLLRERIIFLGSSIDDFFADAIISQLLLLDALDSTKDIRLFINCPGGSLRYF